MLLLDEPLGALDLKLRQQMQIELKAIQKDVGITFIFVTHDQDEALAMSDRLAVFNEGLVEQVGTPSDVYESPQTAFVAGFVGTSNLVSGAAAEAVTGSEARLHRAAREDPAWRAATRPPRRQSAAVDGTIQDVVYLGVNTRYTVQLEPGGELVVIQQNQATSSMDGPGGTGPAGQADLEPRAQPCESRIVPEEPVEVPV